MRNLVRVLSLMLLVPVIAAADSPPAKSPPALDVLSDDEADTMCAEHLPRHLACKNEFCAAIIRIRNKGKQVDFKALEAKCHEEIAVHGTGDLATRKARCSGWSKNRPKMSMSRADAKEMDACWSKPSCTAKIDCWAPKMAKLMESAAPKKQ